MNKDSVLKALGNLNLILQEFSPESNAILISQISNQNPWFTEKSVISAVCGICELLEESNLIKATDQYYLNSNKVVGLISAGNIPGVGFSDLLYVLLSGCSVSIKLSSKDELLMRFLIDQLIRLDEGFNARIKIVEKLSLDVIDGIVATGSDNTSRYFQEYFKSVPNIIRRNRTSVGLLQGDETANELKALAVDVNQYFGLGCRNVTTLFVPRNYDFTPFLKIVEENFRGLVNHSKYSNNYDYYKAVYLVDSKKHLDNGVLLLREENVFFSPVAVLHYQQYDNIDEVKMSLADHSSKIQTLVSNIDLFERQVVFGRAQHPSLFDFPDGENIFEFIQNL